MFYGFGPGVEGELIVSVRMKRLRVDRGRSENWAPCASAGGALRRYLTFPYKDWEVLSANRRKFKQEEASSETLNPKP